MATGLILAVIGLVVFLVPAPSWTTVHGVVSVPDQTIVRGGADGFITKVLVSSGEAVRSGQALVETEDPALRARLAMLEGQRDELESRYQKERTTSIARGQAALEQLKSIEAELTRVRERHRELVLRSPADGRFSVSMPQDLPGRFIKQGEPVGYVVPNAKLTGRVVVPQGSADLVRHRTERVTVRLAERFSEEIPGHILREVPRASDRLPNMALAQSGGGEVALDPTQSNAAKALQTHFEFDISIPSSRATALGERAYVRFEHVREPVAAHRSIHSLRRNGP